MIDAREAIVDWAKWAHVNNAHFNYTEGPQRMGGIGVWPPKFPFFADCSAFVTWCYWIAGAADPNGLNYDHQGYTGTLLSHGLEIPLAQVQPGDVVVYGPGTGWHTALVVIAGADPVTISHGQQGDPSVVKVSQDGRQPQRYLRFNTQAPGIRLPSELDNPVVNSPQLVSAPHIQQAPRPVAEPAQGTPEASQSHPQAPVAPAGQHLVL